VRTGDRRSVQKRSEKWMVMRWVQNCDNVFGRFYIEKSGKDPSNAKPIIPHKDNFCIVAPY